MITSQDAKNLIFKHIETRIKEAASEGFRGTSFCDEMHIEHVEILKTLGFKVQQPTVKKTAFTKTFVYGRISW